MGQAQNYKPDFSGFQSWVLALTPTITMVIMELTELSLYDEYSFFY